MDKKDNGQQVLCSLCGKERGTAIDGNICHECRTYWQEKHISTDAARRIAELETALQAGRDLMAID